MSYNTLNFLRPELNVRDINSISILGLAHIGDGVYELMTRTYLCSNEHRAATDLHRSSVALVNANKQAEAVVKILPHLTDDEVSVYKRGRNAKVNSVPNKSSEANYHAATGLEALFGYLYLHGEHDRLDELFSIIME